jgi:membrane protein implicated in regulation of membrane protease activity
MNLLLQEFAAERFPQKSRATVEWPIAATRQGKVYWQATYWTAEFENPTQYEFAYPGQSVDVIAIRGNTLLVAAIS